MRIVYIGTGGIGMPALRALIARPGCEVAAAVTQPDRPAGRGNRPRASGVKLLAVERGIPVLQPEKMRDPAAVAGIAAFAPDVIVVMAYGQILPRAVLDLPRLACLNLHASLLPRHRGASPIQAAVAQGDGETGITVMYMAEGLDTGDILLARRLSIRENETAGTLHDRLADLAPAALADALDLLAAGAAPRIPQDDSFATFTSRLNREDGRIDWSRPACEIDRHIRAMNPWPVASAELPLADGGRARLKIFSAAIEPCGAGLPGTLQAADDRGIVMGTPEGAVRLLEVQGEGGRRMPAGEWQRGHAVAIGAR
ncbi:MAG: methionyl-tRNA formyltransferase [Terrimicrobiaceae bacterium]|nr:methionyl-tRNA formyltransferase [Terrimicrobiaceae bacterium]